MTVERSRTFLVLLLLALFTQLTFPAAAATKKKKDAEGKDDKAAKAEEKWDVNAPPGETYDVEIDVTTGTWMSVDVSPDGEELVFDLLGDIYTLPITGGDATALTSGMAWDMQPRYSPDGKSIAFTSDQGGGDNIWIMDRQGENHQQVSKEDFRLLNSPAWSPDSQYIVARKHFTSRRSLGAGEIWLYHRSGGSGLQLNERPNDQKDLGEPAFSPDGRYVYYSRDSTPGNVFEYNKDSNTQIYTIHRLDRETGDNDVFVRGPGGAIRPTPSPDGQYLAFVRRVRFKTVLFLHNLETGENRPLFDGLERDMQETWAIHGVYPAMAWAPDGASLVFYAQGGLHRIDVASGNVAQIPFRVRQTHKMQPAVRHRVEVQPSRFDVKMLRWVQVSPAGDQVVYQALGKLWTRDLPNGEPRRLTRSHADDGFELYPSFSRDGKEIVYVTWNDDDLGAVQVVGASGGEGRRVTEKPGHYAEPAFSPDGQTIVYRKFRGGRLTSPLYSNEPGLHKIAASGGDGERISPQGFQPHFGADNNRVYFMTREAQDKRALRSIALAPVTPEQRGERHHLTSEAATEMRISPDGQWIAFTERFNTYLAPFLSAVQTINLGPKTKSIPVRQVSKDTGDYLHFSGDSSKLYWSLGPELFERDLKDAFAFMDGAPEELPEPVAEGRAIGFNVPTDFPSGAVAFVGARVITMKEDEVLENATVVVNGNRIYEVGPADEVEIPVGSHEIDASGMTIIPGLIDVHWHGGQGVNEITPQRNFENYATLAFGVTTIHDPSNDTSTFFAASELAKAGRITAPRLYTTGTILYGAAGDFKAIVNNIDDARSHLRRMKAVGAFSVKSYNQPRRDQRQQVLAAARELEIMVMPEGGSLFMHNMTMVVDGHTGIEHSLPVANVYDDVVQLWSKSDTGYTPTLTVAYGGLTGEYYWYQKTNVWENERLLSFVPAAQVDPRSRRRLMAPDEEFNHIAIASHCKKLADAGVRVNVGAHGQREGLAAHWEIWMLVQGGMTPHEALHAATMNGAYYIGMDDQIGSIEVGKLADLAILAENPLDDIRHSESVVYTMVNGRLYDAATMDEIGNHPKKRGKLFFEEMNAAVQAISSP